MTTSCTYTHTYITFIVLVANWGSADCQRQEKTSVMSDTAHSLREESEMSVKVSTICGCQAFAQRDHVRVAKLQNLPASTAALGWNAVFWWDVLALCFRKKGALKVATSLDLFGHTSVLSSVEKARAMVATRKPSKNAG